MTALQSPPRERRSTRLRSSRPLLLFELAMLALGYFAYASIRVAVRGNHQQAIQNGLDLFRDEQRLGIAPEVWLNHIVNAHELLARLSGYYYTTLHFVLTIIVIVWLYWRHPAHYRQLRTTLVIGTLVALIGFWLFPVAPPRAVLPNLTDTVSRWDIMEFAAPRGGSSVANLDAAMPSLHVGWAMWCALAVWQVFRHRHPRLAPLAFIYPLLTTLVVLGTANHYLLDCFAGVAAIGLGYYVSTLVVRMQLGRILREPHGSAATSVRHWIGVMLRPVTGTWSDQRASAALRRTGITFLAGPLWPGLTMTDPDESGSEGRSGRDDHDAAHQDRSGRADPPR
jgi:hypothetical protein